MFDPTSWRSATDTITTPCAVCEAKFVETGAAIWKDRGVAWPMTSVKGIHVHKICASELERRITDATDGTLVIDADGVGRWSTNRAVIPAECAHQFAYFGLAPGLDVAATAAARDIETAQVLARYRARRAEQGYSGEELAEMAAAFGPGADVVDVITGQKITLPGSKSTRCATVSCKRDATTRITYDYRNDGEFTSDDVCTPCAESYGRRPVLTHFTAQPL